MDFSLLYVRINFWRDQGNTNSGKHNQSEIHSFDLLFIVDLEKIIVGNRWLWHVFSFIHSDRSYHYNTTIFAGKRNNIEAAKLIVMSNTMWYITSLKLSFIWLKKYQKKNRKTNTPYTRPQMGLVQWLKIWTKPLHLNLSFFNLHKTHPKH